MIRPYHINVDMELKSCSTIEQTQTHFQARAESFTAPHRPDFAVFRGRGHCTYAPALPLGGGPGPPVPDAAVDRAGLSSVRACPRRAARAGLGPPRGAAAHARH